MPNGVTAAPTLSSSNGTPTGNAVTATFAVAGTYSVDVTIANPGSGSIVVPLSVVVGQVLTSITVTPASPVSVPAGGTQNFSAIALDQFGIALVTQPTFVWTIANGGSGTINPSTGAYTAPGTVGATATVTATSGAVSKTASVTTIAASQTPTALTGTVIGTSGSWNNSGTTVSNVFDGNTSTFFDAPTAGTTGSPDWVGLDLGSAYTITSITFAPRVGFESRMVGGFFQGSNDPTFTTGDMTLGTITTAPADGYTTISSSGTGSYRYVRYVAPAGGYGNIAELKFSGMSPAADTQAPTTPGTPTLKYATSTSVKIAWAAATDNVGVAYYKIYRNGTQVGTSTTACYVDTGLSSTTAYSYAVYAVDLAGNVSTPSTTLSAATTSALSGTIIGTSGSYDGTSTIAKVFDGNLNTFFDAPTAGTTNSPNWVGLDYGAATTHRITAIAFAPRVGFESRMLGGVFQESNDATFSTGVVTLATITSTPADGVTTIAVSGLAGYRYVRYVAPPGGYGNIAEMQVFGTV
jgi:hypothetical protein